MAKPTEYRCNNCGWQGTEADDCGLSGASNCACPVCLHCCNLTTVGPEMEHTTPKKVLEDQSRQEVDRYKGWIEDLHRKGEIP